MNSSSDEPVKVAYARSQMEAEMIQGLLSEHGIPSMLKRAGADNPYDPLVGPRHVLVAGHLAAQAREALEGTPGVS